MTYEEFIAAKMATIAPAGFESSIDEPYLFPFQRAMVHHALSIGRGALFADTGLGKTRMQLCWADHVARHANGRVLYLTPLAVGAQTKREADACNLDGVTIARDQSQATGRINITNYERLHLFDPAAFVGVVLDESSILKAFSGTTKKLLCSSFASTPYRLAATATPAPNDHLELGNHSEFLGILTSHQMIARWFINDYNKAGEYRLKGHAVDVFWDWIASWARLASKPSDMGPFDDSAYNLPPLVRTRHFVDIDIKSGRKDGQLIRMIEMNATQIHAERRRTAPARADRVAELVTSEPDEPWVIWIETDYDGEEIRKRLPGLCEVKGSDKPEVKESRLLAFSSGNERVMMTKPSIAGFGLNWQHCARMAFAGPSYSYESDYQAIRRCYRFGQARPVESHQIFAKTEQAICATLDEKEAAHLVMKESMHAAALRAVHRAVRPDPYVPTCRARLPSWLRTLEASHVR